MDPLTGPLVGLPTRGLFTGLPGEHQENKQKPSIYLEPRHRVIPFSKLLPAVLCDHEICPHSAGILPIYTDLPPADRTESKQAQLAGTTLELSISCPPKEVTTVVTRRVARAARIPSPPRWWTLGSGGLSREVGGPLDLDRATTWTSPPPSPPASVSFDAPGAKSQGCHPHRYFQGGLGPAYFLGRILGCLELHGRLGCDHEVASSENSLVPSKSHPPKINI